MGMPEKVYFSDNQIAVSNMRIIIKGLSYPIQDISRAVMREEKPYRSFGTGLCATAIGLFGFIWVANQMTPFVGNWLVSFYLGFAVLFSMGFVLRYAPTTYALLLDKPFGQVKALESKDPKYILNVCSAINSAHMNR